jgi:hypothetical protein
MEKNLYYGELENSKNKIIYVDNKFEKYDPGNYKNKRDELKEKVENWMLYDLYKKSEDFILEKRRNFESEKLEVSQVPDHIVNIRHPSPFWATIMAPILAKSLKINYERLKKIDPRRTACISYYLGHKINHIFYNRFPNLFRLSFLFPVEQATSCIYRLKNISTFINSTHQFSGDLLISVGGSRIFLVRLIENFIGKVKWTGFASTYSGNSIDVKINDEFELETIEFLINYFQGNFQKEIESVQEIIAKDLSNKQDNDKCLQYSAQGYHH